MILTQKLKLKEDDVKENEELLQNQIKALKFQLETEHKEVSEMKKKMNDLKFDNTELQN